MAPQHSTTKPMRVPRERQPHTERARGQSMSSGETVSDAVKRIHHSPWAAKEGDTSVLPSFCPAPTPEDMCGGDGVVRTDPTPLPVKLHRDAGPVFVYVFGVGDAGRWEEGSHCLQISLKF